MPEPKYMTIVNDLRDKIRTGHYRSGDKLPSRTELAEAHKVSLITVNQAMFVLRSEGLTETVPGVGVFVK